MKHKRLEGEEYVHLIDEFMAAVRDKWPDVLVQFEDFTNDHAFSLLARYRKKYFCFNDDIQGTGAVITAGFLNAAKLSGIPLDKHRLVFLGAGSAGVGVADAIVNAMVHDESCKGLTEHAARKFFWFLDSRGLITKNRSGTLEEHKVSYAREDNGDKQYASLLEVVKNVKPTALIGLAGLDGGVFTKEIIEAMAEYNQRPIIFALSNPTKKSECTAEDAYKFTDGKCIFASGSPFDDVVIKGKTYVPSQGNNMYIFPGLGFGAVVARAKEVTENMLMVSARKLSQSVTEQELKEGRLYPKLDRMRDISAGIAASVLDQAFKDGVAQIEKPANSLEYVKNSMFYPSYLPLNTDSKL